MEYKTLNKTNLIITCPMITIFKNIIISYMVTLLLFVIFSFVITYTDIPISTISPISISITIISILFASILNGKNSSEKGWLTGCITGFIYMFILYVVGSIIYKNPGITSNGFIMIIIGMLSGITGSIIGINNRKKYRK